MVRSVELYSSNGGKFVKIDDQGRVFAAEKKTYEEKYCKFCHSDDLNKSVLGHVCSWLSVGCVTTVKVIFLPHYFFLLLHTIRQPVDLVLVSY